MNCHDFLCVGTHTIGYELPSSPIFISACKWGAIENLLENTMKQLTVVQLSTVTYRKNTMPRSDAFRLIAEIAVAIPGFSGIVVGAVCQARPNVLQTARDL